MRKLHIIISCTARKRASDAGYPRLRNVSRTAVADRCAGWVALVSATPRRYVAAELYAGEYWQAAMGLASCARLAGPTMVSVVSAGLGLVGLDDQVPMYGATFAPRHADSVLATSDPVSPSHARREWWERLTRAQILGPRHPPRLARLGEDGFDTSVMVCVGRDYIDAVAADLLALVEHLGDPERVMVFASGAPLAGLAECWIAVPGNLRLTLGGSMSSVTPRAAKAVLEELGTFPPDAAKARRVVAALTARAGELPSFDRRRQPDDVIVDWILDHLAEDPHVTKTAALRRFRSEDKACEHARFGRLFDHAREMAT